MSIDLREWLIAHGFDDYVESFEAAEIDIEALPGLTDAHLKELEIPIGPRIKLLRAIADTDWLAADGVELAPSQPDDSPPDDSMTRAERRHLTVMFVDLVGSTELAGRLDPEDLRHLIGSYQDVVAGEVSRYEGHVAQYLGDGVLAYFGYPLAHEDDAERAVRAALAVLDKVREIRIANGESLSIRVGIATGLVVVGELLVQGSGREHTAVGETPNLAARLQGIALPGQAVVSQATRELLAEVFELQDLREQTLKGIAAPVTAYVVVKERVTASRFDTAGRRLGSLVGREGELLSLRERWSQALAGEGSAVVIVGDPGIGKSRLVRAFQSALRHEGHTQINYQCSPHHTTTALFPITQQLRGAIGVDADADSESRLDGLEALLGEVVGERANLAVFAAVLGIDGTSRYGGRRFTPEQQRQRMFDVMLNLVEALAGAGPLLLVIEDAHWIDPTTQELVELLAERLASLPVMLVISTRPHDPLILGDASDVGRLVLTRMSRTQIATVINSITGGRELPDELLKSIAVKADGVPLFAEELTRTVLDSAASQEGSHGSRGLPSSAAMTVPASLQDSLMARLDRMGATKDIAQTAACIGRDFDFSLLAAVVDADSTDVLEGSLSRLTDADLITASGTPPQVRFGFRHALMRDAAYESVLHSRREVIHGRIVNALAERPDTPAELLAWHATRAGLTEAAIDYWHLAAQRAMDRPAFKEALAHLQEALQLVESMGDDPKWLVRRLQVLLLMGQASIPLYGYGHADTVATFARAQELVGKDSLAPHGFIISYAVWVARYIRGEQDTALEIGREMLAAAQRSDNPGHMITALRSLAISQMITGSPVEAEGSFVEALERSRDLVRPDEDKRVALAQRFAAEPGIATEFHHGFTLWSLGRISESRVHIDTALAEARAMRHAHTLSHALAHAAIYAVLSRDASAALDLSEETIAYADRYELEMWRGYGALLNGCAKHLVGEAQSAVPLMERGFEIMKRTQTGTMVRFFHAVAERVLAGLGRDEQAQQHALVLDEELRSGSERYFWPECWRLRGECISLRPGHDPDEVEAAFRNALTLARDQGAKTWELYAALGLARYWVERDDPRRAVDLLVPIHQDFAEGHALAAYAEATALLEGLDL